MDIKKAYEMCLAKTERHMEMHKGAYEYGGLVFDGNYEKECTSNHDLNHRANWMTSFVTGMGVLAYVQPRIKSILIGRKNTKRLITIRFSDILM